MPKIEFIFDYESHSRYPANGVIPAIAANHSAELEYRSMPESILRLIPVCSLKGGKS